MDGQSAGTNSITDTAPGTDLNQTGATGRRITEAEALDRLRDLVGYGRTQSDIAKEVGVSPAFVSAVFKGHKPATSALLALAGVERRTEFYLREGS